MNSNNFMPKLSIGPRVRKSPYYEATLVEKPDPALDQLVRVI
jgi:hypothetical protein